MENAWIGVSVTLGLFFICHLITTVWWASRVNTLLDVVQRNLIDLVAEVKAINKTAYSKEDASKDQAINDKEHRAMWLRLDALSNKYGNIPE